MRNLIILLAVLLFTGCNTQHQNKIESFQTNALSSENVTVQYFTKINSDDNWYEGAEVYEKNNFDIADYVINGALKGEIEVYENTDILSLVNEKENKKLSIDELKHRLGIIYQTISYNDETGNEITEDLQTEPSLEEITEIGFIENWLINPIGFLFNKEVLQYNFVREYEFDEKGSKRKVPVFSVVPNIETKSNANWELACTKATEVYIATTTTSEALESTELEQQQWIAGNSLFNDRNPIWSFYSYHNLITCLFEAVNNKTLKTYDFKTKEPIDSMEIELRMGVVETSISYVDENGEEVSMNMKEDLNIHEIKSLIFVEDWFFDKNTFALKKEIKGIAPIRYYRNDQKELMKTVVFFVPLN